MDTEVTDLEEMTLGGLIRALRKQNHLTQAMLAEKLGITDKAVSKWERDISYPDIGLFPSLADVLGVSTDDLLKRCAGGETPSRLARIFQMSHDIRTPLNVILGCTDLAVKYHEDRDQLMRYLRNIRFSGEYLLSVIDRLMAVTQQDGEAGQDLPHYGDDGALPSADAIREIGDAARGYDFTGRRVLLVEDIELNREIAMELIRQTGASVECAGDGLIGLEMVEAAPPDYYDLILMDIQMPRMDGIEATRRIRALPDAVRANLPIIAMTANVYEADRRVAFEAGMNDFTVKPIVTEQLYETMRRAMERRG